MAASGVCPLWVCEAIDNGIAGNLVNTFVSLYRAEVRVSDHTGMVVRHAHRRYCGGYGVSVRGPAWARTF